MRNISRQYENPLIILIYRKNSILTDKTKRYIAVHLSTV